MAKITRETETYFITVDKISDGTRSQTLINIANDNEKRPTLQYTLTGEDAKDFYHSLINNAWKESIVIIKTSGMIGRELTPKEQKIFYKNLIENSGKE